jgi:hypothetical protein
MQTSSDGVKAGRILKENLRIPEANAMRCLRLVSFCIHKSSDRAKVIKV